MPRASVQLNVRVHPDLAERIADAADRRGVSHSWLVERLLTEALDLLAPGPLRLLRSDGADSLGPE